MGVYMTKIMLVEDDKSLREIYGVRLLAEGYEIISAGDGEEALAMAVKEKPDLILSDVMMPKISGFDMLDILRSTPETKDVKVIMMTALSSEDQRARGETLGANRYLVKSQVGIEDVVRTVHDLLGDVPTTAEPVTQFGPPAQSAAINQQTAPVEQTTEPVIEPVFSPIEDEAVQTTATVEPSTPTQQDEVSPIAPPTSVNEAYDAQPVLNTESITVTEPTPIPPTPELNPQPTEQPQPTYSSNLDTVAQPQTQTPAPIQPTQPQPQMPVQEPYQEVAQPQTPPQAATNPTPAPILPIIETAPSVSQNEVSPNESQLPRPTAPFSTNAPASLGERIINPITPPAPKQDIAALIDQELHDGSATNPTATQ